jgi:hypothetical protein
LGRVTGGSVQHATDCGLERKAEKVDARSLYILRPELVGAAMATDRDRLGLANKGESGGS